MLSIKIVQIKYGNKLVLKDVELKASSGEITTIIGPSGSGKTSVLNTIVSTNDTISTFDFAGIDITHMDDDEKQKFILKHISFVSQNYDFISDLRILDHIKLIHEITQSSNDYKEIINELNIGDLLNKYPNELSGGEKSRISLYLAILKNPDIIILDEPTASLDLYNTQCVIDVLSKIKTNKIVIVATHDEKIIHCSDKIYSIEGKTLILKTEDNHMLCDKELDNVDKNYKVIPKNISKILTRMKKHEKIYQKIVMFMTIMMISFSSFATGFNNIVKTTNTNMMNQLSSTEILIYKPSGGYPDQGISHSSEGNEIVDTNELESIKNISHVDEIRPRVDIEMCNPFVLMIEDKNYRAQNSKYNLIIKDNGKDIDKTMELSNAPTLNSYYNDKDYSQAILREFNQKNGVYISKMLADYLCDNIEDLNGTSLEFDIYIPVYNSVGKAWAESSNGDIFWPNITSCKVERITLPVSGILKSSSMGINNSQSYAIYVENQIIMNLVDKYKPISSRTCYLIKSDDFKFSVDKKPPEEDILREIKEEIWTPKSFSVFVDDITQVESVALQIAHKGFNVSNIYMNIDAVNQALDSVQKIIQMASYVLTVLIFIVYIIVKLNNKKKEKEVDHYLKHLGVSYHQRRKINCLRYMHNTVVTIICSILLLILFIFISRTLYTNSTGLNPYMFIIAVVSSVVIEFIIPILIERVIINDRCS